MHLRLPFHFHRKSLCLLIAALCFSLMANAAAPIVIPNLQEWTDGIGTFKMVSGKSRICIDPAYSTQLTSTANTFRDDINGLNGLTLKVVITSSPRTGDFYLTLNCSDTGLGIEGYKLEIRNYSTIRSQNIKGVFYGTRTAMQILKQSINNVYMPQGIARDFPKYNVRSFFLDAGYTHFTVDYIKDIIKILSWYKLNSFHLYFADDKEFHLESETYPGLANNPLRKYTYSDISSIIALSNQYNVNIVPEIDMPSHAGAITTYNPSIKNKTFPTTVNLAKAETYTFLDKLLDEFVPLFPGAYFSLGTDETPNDGRRGTPYNFGDCDSDPETLNYAISLGYSTAGELYRKFINRYNSYLRNKGKTTWVWAWFESVPGCTPINNNIIYNAWLADYVNKMSTNGFNILNSSASYLYTVPGSSWQPNNAYLYESWYPYIFGSFSTKANLSSDDSHILGAEFCNWNDISDKKGFNEIEIGRICEPTLRVLSEVTWGGPRLGNYANYIKRISLIGAPPALVTLIGTEATNLALYRPTTASSYISSTDPVFNAIDGAASTSWSSKPGSDPQWLSVDLGEPFNINKVRLKWGADYGRSYQIQISDDATSWTTVFNTTTGGGGIDNCSFKTTTARYVRMYSTQSGTNSGYSINEFEVYPDDTSKVNYNRNELLLN